MNGTAQTNVNQQLNSKDRLFIDAPGEKHARETTRKVDTTDIGTDVGDELAVGVFNPGASRQPEAALIQGRDDGGAKVDTDAGAFHEELVQADTGDHEERSQEDRHANAVADVGSWPAGSLSCPIGGGERNDTLDNEGGADLRSISGDLARQNQVKGFERELPIDPIAPSK